MSNKEKLGLLQNEQPIADDSPPRDSPPAYHALDIERTGEFPHMITTDFRSGENKGGKIDGVERVTLCWKNIHVDADTESTGCCGCLHRGTPAPPKQILKNVSGVVKPGTLQVIMGGSGSGKTTLLNVLTRRNLGQLNVSGQVLVNGEELGDDIASISTYIQQDDLFIGTMTVREYLAFNAKLRMPPDTGEKEREEKIAEVMHDMGLLKSADTVIGTAGVLKSLSGGEMKRLVFAASMLTSPSLMFCDEPTTGLDSFMAQSVVEALLDLTGRGCSILCTIHQPSSQVYAMFNQLLLMAEGRVAFHGPAADVVEFMSDSGFECPPTFNPADFICQTLAVVPGKENYSRETITFVCDQYDESVHSRSVQFHIDNVTYKDKFMEEMDAVEKQYKEEKQSTQSDRMEINVYKSSWMTQFSWCYWRNMLDLRRNKKRLPMFFLNQLIVAFVLGLVYFRQNYNQTGVMNLNSAMLLLCIQVSFGTAFTSAVSFGSKFPVFRREHEDRMYGSTAYYMAQILSDFPTVMIGATGYSVVAYWMIGYNERIGPFFVFVAALVLLAMVASAFGHLFGAMATPQFAMVILPNILLLLLLFSGLLLKSNDLLVIFKPLEWISPFHYTYESLVIDQWKSVKHIDCTNDTSTCYPTGATVLKSLQMDEDSLPLDFICNIILLIVSEGLGMLALHRRVKNT